MNRMNAVCLLSGGLDSSTCLAWAKHQGFACYALSFDYGQRHHTELAAASRVAESIGSRAAHHDPDRSASVRRQRVDERLDRRSEIPDGA